MSGSKIVTFFTSTKKFTNSDMLIRGGRETWRFIRAGIISFGRAIERHGVAADRRRLQLLCEQRHRRWD
jgi:hypothetical protein